MFKNFPGYQLVETYHNWKKSQKRDNKTVSRAIRLIIAIVAALVVWCLPVEDWVVGMTIIRREPSQSSSLPFSCGSLRRFLHGPLQ